MKSIADVLLKFDPAEDKYVSREFQVNYLTVEY